MHSSQTQTRRPSTDSPSSSPVSVAQALRGLHISSSGFPARRRPSLSQLMPPGPPPNEPVPSIPTFDQDTFHDGPHLSSDNVYYHPSTNGSRLGSVQYEQRGGSPNLAAVAAFSEARYIPSSSRLNGTASPDTTPDPPPRPTLPQLSVRDRDQVQDPSLLSPPSTRMRPESRLSSRSRALTKALELAREAVRLDANSDDPYGAVIAYGRSVALLSEVMERVRRGEDSSDSSRKRNGRRRSSAAQETEIRRLKAIVSV